MADFEIVPRDELPPPGSRDGPRPSALSLALERGETVFVPGWKSANGRFYNPRSYLHVRGFKVHQRQSERNGVAGLFLWADKNGSQP